MLELDLYRYHSGKDWSHGILLRRTLAKRTFLCHTLEDEYRTKKKYGETRIPSGKYRLHLRRQGGHHERYATKFPTIHKGMLELVGVPNFTDVLIHIGNTDDDTEGCILVGDGVQTGRVTDSTRAYTRVYPLIADALAGNSDVWLFIYDLDTPEPGG